MVRSLYFPVVIYTEFTYMAVGRKVVIGYFINECRRNLRKGEKSQLINQSQFLVMLFFVSISTIDRESL